MNTKNIAQILCALTTLGVGSVAHAGFINGGFEDGTLTGWELYTGTYSGAGVLSLSPGLGNGNGTITNIGAVADNFSPYDSPFNGTRMVRLNTVNESNFGAARIAQTGIMGVGETDVFINWGAVLDDPGHPTNQQPFFDIQVFKNGNLFASLHNIAGAGWTAESGYFHNAGQYHVPGLVAGDSVRVEMTVADCGQGAHAGWAYLDGIGTQAENPPPGSRVPDGGSTIALLFPALLGLLALRRKI